MFNSRRLMNNAAMSVLQTVTSAFTLFFLYRFLFKNLGPEQLGLWSVVLASTSVTRLSDLGFTGSVVKFVAKYFSRDDQYQCSNVIQTAAITIACVMGLVLIVCYPLLQYILSGVVPLVSISVANEILPFAMVSLWLNTIGGVFQSALDGCQRMYLRSALMIVCNLIYFISAILLAKTFGILGLAMAQVGQSFILLFLCWFFLRKIISLPYFPVLWTHTCFKEMFSYALNFQVSSIAGLFFDPITKFLISKYGGLSNAGYYEMASQMVLKFRSLSVAAIQSIVPAVANLHEKAPAKIGPFYSQTLRIVFCLSLPYYVGVVISLPAISLLWLGSINKIFIFISLLLATAWELNTLCVPAYFCNWGTGDLRANTISHVVMGSLNLIGGMVFGQYFGIFGVAFSTFISISLGGMYVGFSFHRKNNISLSVCNGKEDLPILLYSFSIVVGAIIFAGIGDIKTISMAPSLIAPVGHLIVLMILIWFHPFRLILMTKYLHCKNS